MRMYFNAFASTRYLFQTDYDQIEYTYNKIQKSIFEQYAEPQGFALSVVALRNMV